MHRRAYLVLFVAVFASTLGVGFIGPLMPLYARDLGATGVTLGMIFSGFSMARFIFTPIIGRLSDKRGRRVFLVPWDRVAAEVPAYGDYVAAEMARLGDSHPLVRTQYKLEEIDDASGLFPAARQALDECDSEAQLRGSRRCCAHTDAVTRRHRRAHLEPEELAVKLGAALQIPDTQRHVVNVRWSNSFGPHGRAP